MKISSASDPANLVNQAAAAQKASQGTGAAVSATTNATQTSRSASVSVTVSTQVRGLEEAKRSDAADIDTQKVAAVKASIEDGSFTVNAEAIADKLLSSAQDILSRTRR
jgi:negative regulator of flagellin synthesis FlgM